MFNLYVFFLHFNYYYFLRNYDFIYLFIFNLILCYLKEKNFVPFFYFPCYLLWLGLINICVP